MISSALTPIQQPRVFVVCPGGLVTGGPELLHQLVHALCVGGKDARIVYFPFRNDWKTPDAYSRYQCPVAERVGDDPDCAVVVPEVLTRLLAKVRKARHVVWWLSVDYYLGVTNSVDGWIKRIRRLFTADIPNPSATTHLFQSDYARRFVYRRFGCSGFMLSDYIPADFLEAGAVQARVPAVAFNPKKGFETTQRVMRLFPEISFVPLQGLTRQGMRDALDACMAYIDFGPHPGKDRIPREAALRGAIVFVGKRGSAINAEDVPIDDFYKIEPGPAEAREVGTKLKQVFQAYSVHLERQNDYRSGIAREADAFQSQVRAAFALEPPST